MTLSIIFFGFFTFASSDDFGGGVVDGARHARLSRHARTMFDFGETKVGDFDVSVSVDEDVVGIEIAGGT